MAYFVVFVSARKPTIAPNHLHSANCLSTTAAKNTADTQSTTMLSENFQQQRLPADPSQKPKLTPYNIDYIVSHLVTKQVPSPPPTLDSVQIPQSQKIKSEIDVPSLVDTAYSAKHASTPINNNFNQQTHSPQLPVPSPSLPIEPKDCHKNHVLPNTVVPTINNNYIHNTSQEMKATDSSQQAKIDSLTMQHSVGSNDQSKPPVSLPTKSSKVKVSYRKMFEKKLDKRDLPSFTVLNIPNLSLGTNLQTPSPPTKRKKISKIDLATHRRQIRREKRHSCLQKQLKERKNNINNQTKNKITIDFGVTVYGYSDDSSTTSSLSSSEESEPEINLWIKSGPPCKPDYKPEKLEFLQIFGLTTHMGKNCK